MLTLSGEQFVHGKLVIEGSPQEIIAQSQGVTDDIVTLGLQLKRNSPLPKGRMSRILVPSDNKVLGVTLVGRIDEDGRNNIPGHYIVLDQEPLSELQFFHALLLNADRMPLPGHYQSKTQLEPYQVEISKDTISLDNRSQVLQNVMQAMGQDFFLSLLNVIVGSSEPLAITNFDQHDLIGDICFALQIALPAVVRRKLSFTTYSADNWRLFGHKWDNNNSYNIRFVFGRDNEYGKSVLANWKTKHVRFDSNTDYVQHLGDKSASEIVEWIDRVDPAISEKMQPTDGLPFTIMPIVASIITRAEMPQQEHDPEATQRSVETVTLTPSDDNPTNITPEYKLENPSDVGSKPDTGANIPASEHSLRMPNSFVNQFRDSDKSINWSAIEDTPKAGIDEEVTQKNATIHQQEDETRITPKYNEPSSDDVINEGVYQQSNVETRSSNTPVERQDDNPIPTTSPLQQNEINDEPDELPQQQDYSSQLTLPSEPIAPKVGHPNLFSTSKHRVVNTVITKAINSLDSYGELRKEFVIKIKTVDDMLNVVDVLYKRNSLDVSYVYKNCPKESTILILDVLTKDIGIYSRDADLLARLTKLMDVLYQLRSYYLEEDDNGWIRENYEKLNATIKELSS